MKKLMSLVVVALCLIHCSAYAKTLDERIANVETRYEQRINKINTMRAKEERKEVLKKHAREDADLKIKHLKDLDAVKVAKVTKTTKTSRKSKK